jgi:hypothetical protein
LQTSETSRALLEASLLRLTLSEHFIGLDRLSAQLTSGSTISVKKKIATANTTPSAGSAPKHSAEIGSIQSSWREITAQCAQADSSLGAFLAQAQPVHLENSTLSICFGSDGPGQLAKNACQRKLDVLQKLLSKILSTDITVRIEETDRQSTPPEEKPSDPAPVAETTGVNRQQRQQALNDPAVQMVLKGLNATPVEIQKVEIHSDDDYEKALVDQEAD